VRSNKSCKLARSSSHRRGISQENSRVIRAVKRSHTASRICDPGEELLTKITAIKFASPSRLVRARGSIVGSDICHKPEGRGLDSR
jgi:hypothetical protein